MNRKFNKGWSLVAAVTLLIMNAQAQSSSSGLAAAGAAGPAGAQTYPVHEFSMSQAIDYASKNSVKVKNALLDYKIQEQSNRATTSQALPQISGNAGLTDYLQIPVSVAPGKYF